MKGPAALSAAEPEAEQSAQARVVVLQLGLVVGLLCVLLQLVGAEHVGWRDRGLRRRARGRLHLAGRHQGVELVDRQLLGVGLVLELLLGGGVVEVGVRLVLAERLVLGGVGEAGLALVLRELLGGGGVGEVRLRLALGRSPAPGRRWRTGRPAPVARTACSARRRPRRWR